MRAKIKQVGVEIEGEFSDKFMEQLGDYGGSIKSDGSVRRCTANAFHSRFRYKDLYPMEYASEPIAEKDKGHIKTLFEMFIEASRQGDYHWNRSAGFHIHLSFKPKIPPEIRSPIFTKFMLDGFQKKFPKEYETRINGQWARIEGLDDDEFLSHCKRTRGRDRHRAINFESLYKHGTIEIRLFPSARPSKMFEYYKHTIRLVKKYLKSAELHRFVNDVEEISNEPRERNFEGQSLLRDELKSEYNV
jgi:hypothetical protein